MYRPIKKRRKATFDVQRLSDTHYHAKSTLDFESPYQVKKRHYEFPIEHTEIYKTAEENGLEVLMPPDRAMRSYRTPKTPNAVLDPRLYPHQREGVLKAIGWLAEEKP